MAQKKSTVRPVLTIALAALVVCLALPDSANQFLPELLRKPSLHYGLDLAGGTQLDFRISEREIEEQIAQTEEEADRATGEEKQLLELQLHSLREQKQNLVEAIRTVLERRVNALGVSEAVITPSYIADEKHLLVECPGVVDTQDCIDTVGKTIQLEFKEQMTEQSEEHESSVRAQVKEAVASLRDGKDLETVAQDYSSEVGIAWTADRRLFKDELPQGLDDVWSLTPSDGVIQREGSIVSLNATGDGVQEVPGIFLTEAISPRTATGRTVNNAEEAFSLLVDQEENLSFDSFDNRNFDESVHGAVAGALRTMEQGDLRVIETDSDARILFLRQFIPGREEMSASHILVSYEGASSASNDVTRTKEEALAFAAELKTKLDGGADFASLAKEHSDGPSGKEGGSLGTFGRNRMVPAFEAAAFALAEGNVSEPVETEFGFHIIQADKAASSIADQASYEELRVEDEAGARDRADTLLARLQTGNVTKEEQQVHIRTLFFSLLPSGWKDTPLDGKHFRSATVTLDPVTNIPVVQIAFDQEGGRMFQELTKANIGKPIAIFVGGELVSAPTVQQEITGGTAIITGSTNFEEARLLAQDLNTGAIPAPIHLAGQRTVEATLGAQSLETSLQAALLGIVILMVYMIVVYRALGVLANIALFCYALLFLALLKLPLFLFSSQHVVLTLAGMAGIILSIGMAVDANVLIFERVKEELKKGKMLKTAAETGFERAWPSIRDGNVSTFLTCSILFLIGTSIVKGFAVTLGMGVAISMFSAIVITRFLVRKIASTSLGEKKWLFC